MSIEQGDSQPRLISTAEFVADAEGVIDKANESGRPVVVTGRGRFLFLVEPIEDLDIHTDITEAK